MDKRNDTETDRSLNTLLEKIVRIRRLTSGRLGWRGDSPQVGQSLVCIE